jgi:hypothetical protein
VFNLVLLLRRVVPHESSGVFLVRVGAPVVSTGVTSHTIPMPVATVPHYPSAVTATASYKMTRYDTVNPEPAAPTTVRSLAATAPSQREF